METTQPSNITWLSTVWALCCPAEPTHTAGWQLITVLWSKFCTKPLTQSFLSARSEHSADWMGFSGAKRWIFSSKDQLLPQKDSDAESMSPDPGDSSSLRRGIARCNFVASFLSDIISSERNRNIAVIWRGSPGHTGGRKENRATQLTPELDNCKTVIR